MTDFYELMRVIGEWLSFGAGLSLLFFGLLVMRAYSPRSWKDKTAAGYLAVAIFLAFALAVANTVYWQVFSHPARHFGWFERDLVLFVGRWLDGIFKGGAAFAAYLHLKALHANLSNDERRNWGVIEMAFYPNRVVCLNLLMRAIRRRTKK